VRWYSHVGVCLLWTIDIDGRVRSVWPIRVLVMTTPSRRDDVNSGEDFRGLECFLIFVSVYLAYGPNVLPVYFGRLIRFSYRVCLSLAVTTTYEIVTGKTINNSIGQTGARPWTTFKHTLSKRYKRVRRRRQRRL